MQDKLTNKEALVLYAVTIYYFLYGKIMMYRVLQLLNDIGLITTPCEIQQVFQKAIRTGRIRFGDSGLVFVKTLSGDFSNIANILKFKIQHRVINEWFNEQMGNEAKQTNKI